jgi:N utilization substance protein B
MITSTSENWSLERMPLVDLNILRLATFEMLYLDDVPQSVSINEAVELAKNFGGEDDSSRFVNGVLGRIAVIIEQNSRLGRDKNYLAEQLAAQMEPAAQLEPVPQLEPVSQMEPVPQMDSAAMQQEPAVMQQLAARPAAAVMAEQLA